MKTLIITFCLLSVGVVACAVDPKPVEPAEVPPVAEPVPSSMPEPAPKKARKAAVELKPTKGAAADLLIKLCTAVEKHDVDTIIDCWHPFPEAYEAQMRRAFTRKNGVEIHREALDKLIKFGEWGPISEVYPSTNLANLLGHWELDASQCWALRLRPAEVALHWDGEAFHVIECDDVNKPRLLQARER